MRLLMIVIPLLLIIPLALASQSSSAGGGVGATQVVDKQRREPFPGEETIEVGEPRHTNGDGVKVCNTGDGSDDEDGDFKVNPKSGNGNSPTTVEAQNDAKGTVEGLDGNDTVNCANGSNVTISGTGGTVNANSGSVGSVTNTNPAGGGGASITVNVGGGSVTVPPGGTITFSG